MSETKLFPRGDCGDSKKSEFYNLFHDDVEVLAEMFEQEKVPYIIIFEPVPGDPLMYTHLGSSTPPPATTVTDAWIEKLVNDAARIDKEVEVLEFSKLLDSIFGPI